MYLLLRGTIKRNTQVNLQHIQFSRPVFQIIFSNTKRMLSSQLELCSMNQQLKKCRVCYESTQPILTLPCRCLSDNSHIHWECLRKIKQFKNKGQCDVCRSKFQIGFIQADAQRITRWDWGCKCNEYECCQMFRLIIRIVLFVSGFMLALTPIHIKMELLYTYLCIGIGSLLVYLSNQMKPANTNIACRFCSDCLCSYLCRFSQCNQRSWDISCCWCLQYQSWIPKRNIGLTLKYKAKEVHILY